MAKYCNVCHQSYAVEYGSCPFCEVPTRLDGSRPRLPASTDDSTPLPLGAGLTALPTSRPPSRELDKNNPMRAGRIGASEPRENRAPAPIGPRSSAKMLLDQAGPHDRSEVVSDENDASIDLGSPTRDPGTPEGPPSGASFVSWTALINERKDFDDEPVTPSARAILNHGVAPAVTPAASPRRTSPWLYVVALAIGIVLAFLLNLKR